MGIETTDKATLDVREAARVLGVSEPSLRRAITAGRIPTVDVAGIRRILISRSHVERILNGSESTEARRAVAAA